MNSTLNLHAVTKIDVRDDRRPEGQDYTVRVTDYYTKEGLLMTVVAFVDDPEDDYEEAPQP